MGLTSSVALSSAQLEHPALWKLRVEIRNDDGDAVRLSTATMLGGVAFEVVDDAGARIALGPPPMPPDDLAAGLTSIAPGGTLTLDFHGDELFADAPEPGSYRLRFAARAPDVDDAWSGAIVSPWVPFAVAA